MAAYHVYTWDYWKYTKQYQKMSFRIYLIASHEAKMNGLDKGLVLAVIDHESARTWNPMVDNGRGDQGLMQINKVHKLINPYDAQTNIAFGCKFLKKCIDRKRGNKHVGILSYNAGPNRKYYTNLAYLAAIERRTEI